MTLEEARRKRYGVWSQNVYGDAYEEGRCAFEVVQENGYKYQCSQNNGCGPDRLYCRKHAEIVWWSDIKPKLLAAAAIAIVVAGMLWLEVFG